MAAFTRFQTNLLRYYERQMEAAEKGIMLGEAHRTSYIMPDKKDSYLTELAKRIEMVAAKREPTVSEERACYELLGDKRSLVASHLSENFGGPLPATLVGVVLGYIDPLREKQIQDHTTGRGKVPSMIVEETDRDAFPQLCDSQMEAKFRELQLQILAANMDKPPREEQPNRKGSSPCGYGSD